MKKYFVLILTCVLVNILPADDFSLSAGAGLSLGGLFTRYTLTTKTIGEVKQEMNQFNFGGFLFFDATYAEFSFGVQGGFNNYTEGFLGANMEGKGSETMLTFTLLGKYPFTLGDRFKLFPLLGIEYQIALAETRTPEGQKRYNRTEELNINGNPYKLSVWDSLFILAGCGADFNLTSRIYLRGEILYGFRLQTSYETDQLSQTKIRFSDPNPKLGGLTSGPTLRLAVGFNFGE